MNNWSLIIEISLLSVFLGIATYLKRNISFLEKFLIPNSIIAGFIGLIVGPEVLKLIPLDSDSLGNLVYHLMAVGFIALALKERNVEKNTEVTNTGAFIVSTYLIQGIIGFLITIFLALTVMPDLFPPFGMLLPLGYGQGPGQAYSIGKQWEAVGFPHGGNIGLTIAALGFLWACIGGVPLINYLVRKHKFHRHGDKNHPVYTSPMVREEDSPEEIPLSESIDRVTVQIFLIGIIYLITYLSIKGASLLLANLGSVGETLANLLWGFHFIIGSLFALGFRIITDTLKKNKIMLRNYPNNFLLQRIAGGSFDFMVTAGIAAISLTIVKDYWLPIFLISSIGMIITMVYVTYVCKKVYSSHIIESTVALYGMLTGTISTGLALLREVDPNFETPVSKHLVLGSGVGLIFGFPLMFILSIPVTGYVTGQTSLYYLTLLIMAIYLGILFLIILLNRRKEKKKAKQ